MNFRFYLVFIVSLFILPHQSYGQEAEHLPSTINSEYEEREPTFSPDGKTMYYWRRKTPANIAGIKDNGDIWISSLVNGNWTQGVHPAAPLNTPQQNFVWQVSPGDDTLWTNRILYSPNQKDAGMGYHVRDKYGNWGNQRYMEIEGYEFKGNYKDYFLVSSGVMLVTNIGESTYGGTDIYAYFQINDTLWGNPINLGSMVNTPGDEDAPFLAKDRKTLYFGSNGHNLTGDHDIFYCQRLDNSWKNWSKPKPVGRPINSKGYDYDFQLTPDEEWAYWCSDQNTFGGNDIFRMKLNTCELTLYPKHKVSICEGDSVVLEAGFSTGNPIYRWLKNGIPIAGAYDRTLTVRASGDYKVIRVNNHCTDTSEVRNVTVKPVPLVTLMGETEYLCENDSILLMAISQAEVSYQWFRNGRPIFGATKPKLYAKTAGNFAVKISNGNCDRISEIYSIKTIGKPYITHNAQAQSKDTVTQWTPIAAPNYHHKDYTPKSIEKDSEGNLFLSGILEIRNERSLRVESYNKDGNLRWSNPQVLLDNSSTAFSVMDINGNLYVATNTFYLMKYSNTGSILWQKDTRMEKITGIATDPYGNVMVSGFFTDTLNIDGQEIVSGTRGSIFVAKHSASGKLSWLRTYAVDKPKSDFGNALNTDCSGNIYLGGRFERVANFINPVLRALTNEDQFFLAKFSPDGSLEWAKKISTPAKGAYSGDFSVNCDGSIAFLANNKLFKLNGMGGMKEAYNIPLPGLAEKLRVQTVGGKNVISGISREQNRYFLMENTGFNQNTLIWEGNHSKTEEKEAPVIKTDELGNIYFAGSVQGKAIVGATPSGKSAASVTISKYGVVEILPKPAPLHLCPGESVVLSTENLKGVAYEWFRNEIRIANTQPFLTVSEAGDYTIQIKNKNCLLRSHNISVSFDCDKSLVQVPKPQPPTARVTPPLKEKPKPNTKTETPNIAENKPVKDKKTEKTMPPPKPPKPDLVVDARGKPVNLKKRRVKLQKEFDVENHKVKVSVWDYAAVDNDTISLNINGEWVLQRYRLQKQRKVIEVDFKPNSSNYIILYAHNLGSIPPNTITIAIDDGVDEKVTRLESDLKSCGYLSVKHIKKSQKVIEK